ncbi:pheromone-processing carboxypeptidase KEX1-like [Senna tora]|uniref:Pheromone-processing carboxypeptidase KEX1-like n=1 Tax=Senna tora TaxID=362788 RepID=A0A834WTV5_9FABA|nr:pheromone-processing carboxypeptidase KEX1-like [Senna tora]
MNARKVLKLRPIEKGRSILRSSDPHPSFLDVFSLALTTVIVSCAKLKIPPLMHQNLVLVQQLLLQNQIWFCCSRSTRIWFWFSSCCCRTRIGSAAAEAPESGSGSAAAAAEPDSGSAAAEAPESGSGSAAAAAEPQQNQILVLECEIGSAMEERVEAENEEMVDGDHVERVDVNLADPYRTMILEAAGPRCKVHPRYGIIEINRKKHFSKYEPFVLAQQSQQVYFAEYASKKRDRADWLVVCKIKSRSAINAPEIAYQEDEVSIQNEIDDDDEDPQEELGDEEEVGEEVEIEIEDDDVNDQEDIVEMDEFNDQDDIEGGFEIDDSSTEDENEDSEDQIDYDSDGDNTSEENTSD